MARKSKVELTADTIRKAIEERKPTSLAALAHSLGYKGSISSAITGRLRSLLPDVDALVAACKPAKADNSGEAKGKAEKAEKPAKADKPAVKAKSGKAKVPPRHRQNPYREGSAYGVCFDLLAAAGAEGLPREKLVETLAKATGKDPKLASFDAQVCLSARGAASEGLNPFEGPRNRSARFGYWVERKGDHVRLVLPAANAAKETP